MKTDDIKGVVMKKIAMLIMAVMCYFGSMDVSYAKKSSGEERADRVEDIIDIFNDEDNGKKHKDHPGNSKNGKDNHGQNKKDKK